MFEHKFNLNEESMPVQSSELHTTCKIEYNLDDTSITDKGSLTSD